MTVKDYRDTLFKSVNYVPNPEQAKIHDSDARIKLVAGGWRAGKSVVGAKEALTWAPRADLIWLVGLTYEIPRNSEFKYLIEDCQKLSLLDKNGLSYPEKGPCKMTLINGCRIVTKSANDPTQLGMEAPDFVLICEAGLIDYETYVWLRGRLTEKRAPMIMTGTFEGSIGWYPEFFTLWQGPNADEGKSFSLPSWTNVVLYPSGRDDPEIKKIEQVTPHDVFMEKYAGMPCKPSGIVIPDFSNAIHVGNYEFDAKIPVEIAVDPGYGGSYAVEAIQVKDDEVFLIDEIYLQGYVTEEIVTIMRQRPWGNAVVGGAIDVAGKQHHGMPSSIEVWLNAANLKLDSRHIDVESGVDILRSFLKVNPIINRPKLHVNHSCRGFISECGGGKSPAHGGGPWVRDLNTGKLEEKNDHACKALIYWLVSRFGYTPAVRKSHYGKLMVPDGAGKLRVRTNV